MRNFHKNIKAGSELFSILGFCFIIMIFFLFVLPALQETNDTEIILTGNVTKISIDYGNGWNNDFTIVTFDSNTTITFHQQIHGVFEGHKYTFTYYSESLKIISIRDCVQP